MEVGTQGKNAPDNSIVCFVVDKQYYDSIDVYKPRQYDLR